MILGHLGRHPDSREHLRLAEAGAFLAFDGPSRRHHWSDWRLVDALAALADAGHAARLLLGMDTALASMRSAPGMPYLPATLHPTLIRELGRETADAIFVTNPAQAFAAAWRIARASD
ncbi:hypothetical protein AB0F72_35140 [Actinoplanes sp. NPDC023936]|uniref:phosphotriesterase family protein n=1 Tax=Actinoplanes sp. NPDC023936 TaxID=3154910 RepID=UPI0033F5B479